MKKILKTLLVIAALITAIACLFSCARGAGKEEDTTEPSVTTERSGFEDVTTPPESTAYDSETSGAANSSDADASLTNEEAVEAARAWLGETDPDTGYKYAYSFDGMDENGGEEYFRIRVSWYLEDEDRYSLCGYLLVSEDGKNIQKFDW